MAQGQGVYPDRSDRKFISAAMAEPLLEREEEKELVRRWLDDADQRALDRIINSHIRLVVRVASGFRGYGLPVADLIQQGTIGLLEAANRFDTERGVRFSTYATWWILAAIQEYIVRNSSIVRIGTTPAQKSLFFNLRRLRAKLSDNLTGAMTDEQRRTIARDLHVPLAAVERMEAHLSRPDRSLNAGVGNDESDELQDFLADTGPSPEDTAIERRDNTIQAAWLRQAMASLTPREQQVIAQRFLGETRSTLAEIGVRFGVTKERIRQIEGKALTKLRVALNERVDVGELFLN